MIDKEKQIEEIAKHCCFPCDMECNGECLEGTDPRKCYISLEVAKTLYNAGYRKQSNGCDACKPDHETCGTCARFSDYELDGSGDDRCSANCLHEKCGFYRPVNYCPNCGRKMKGGA